MDRFGSPLVAVVGSLILSCSLILDTSLTEGYPCESDGRCLEGYRCEDWICVRDAEDPSTNPCEEECEEHERCDYLTGECVPICQGVTCPTGELCLESAGGCTPVLNGPGELCELDEDCVGILPGCSDGTLSCACVVPATMVRPGDTQGICLGFPEDTTSCDPCSEPAECYSAVVSSAGDQGLPEEMTICGPVGFKICGGDEDCNPTAPEPGTTVCTFFGWPEDPKIDGWPIGFFAACATPMRDSVRAPGDICEDNGDCDSGLCVPIKQERKACTTPCDGRDQGCRGRFTSCLDSRVSYGTGELLLWEIAPVCGQGPTLGIGCEPGVAGDQNPCGTDAPHCQVTGADGESAICTRVCRKDSDCGDDGALYCAPQGPDFGFCLPPAD